MGYKQKSIFIALSFLVGLEFIFLKFGVLDFRTILQIGLIFTILIIVLILWVLEFFDKWSLAEILADLTYFILPGALFWGVIFLFFSVENFALKQGIIIFSSFMAYLISWSFYQDRTKSILAFNILSVATLITSFFFYQTFWFFYIVFNLPAWQLLIVVFLISLLLFYHMINLCFSFNLFFLIFEIIFSLMITETAWILTFWPTGHMIAGLILTVVFYLIWGIFFHHLENRLSRRIIIEYFLIALAILVLIILFTPWFLFQK